MDKNEKHIVSKFNHKAKGYDKSGFVKSYYSTARKILMDRLLLQKGMNILDIGCGTGSDVIEIANRLHGTGRVIGMDLSDKMIDLARKKASGYINVEFVVGNALSINYHEYFDYVFTTNAFHHFEKKEEIFKKVYQSLKVEGIFLLQDFSSDYPVMRIIDFLGRIGEKAHAGFGTSKELMNLYQSANYRNIWVETFKLNWYKGIMIGHGNK